MSSSESSSQRRPPLWALGSFWSATADPFLDSNPGIPSPSFGEPVALLGLLLNRPHLSRFRYDLPPLLSNLARSFTAAGEIGEDPVKLKDYAQGIITLLEALGEGGVLFIPGGWAGTTTSTSNLFYIARKHPPSSGQEPSNYSLTICNAGPDGLQYHPSIVSPKGPSSKILYNTTLTLNFVPASRMLDLTFWTQAIALWAKPSEYHRSEALYDVLLPWLAGCSTLKSVLVENSTFVEEGEEGDNSWRWRTPARGGSGWRNLLDGVRYHLATGDANLNRGELKGFTSTLKVEALALALEDLNSYEDDLPNADCRVLLEFSCRTAAAAALKVPSLGDGDIGRGREVLRLIERVKTSLAEVAAKEKREQNEDGGEENGGESRLVTSPDPFSTTHLTQKDSTHPLLIPLGGRDDVEIYAGPAAEPRSVHPTDILSVSPSAKVYTIEEAVGVLSRCKRIADDLHSRCSGSFGGGGYSSRTALQLQIVELIREVMTEVIPLPRPTGEGMCIWENGLPSAALALSTLDTLRYLMLTYASAWDGLDVHPTRSFDSERGIISLTFLVLVDCILRNDANGLMTSTLMKEDGGYFPSTSVGSAGLKLPQLAESMECRAPHLSSARSACLSYVQAISHGCKQTDLFDLRQWPGTETVELKKHSTTVHFLRTLIARCGYELAPRDNPQPPPEMESLMDWLTSPGTPLARDHREFGILRDVVVLYRFLMTMEGRETELQRKRISPNDTFGWTLTFDDDSLSTGSAFRGGGPFGRVRGGGNLRFEVLNYRGQDVDTADIKVTAFGNRTVLFGEGPVVHSPADVTSIVQGNTDAGGNGDTKSGPTEDDVLHAESLPTYGGTLSRQESEMLVSYLTVPYLRIPLVLAFFATGDRVTYLFSPGLRDLVRAVLFDAGPWLPDKEMGLVKQIPVNAGRRNILDESIAGEKSPVLGTEGGLLLNELRRSPEATLRPLKKMLDSVGDLAEASVYSPDAALALYLIDLSLDMQSFFEADGVQVSEERKAEMGKFLTKQCKSILRKWLAEAAEVNDVETMCVIHSYLSLLRSNTQPKDFTPKAVGEFLGSLCFVRNWHGFGLGGDLTEDEGSMAGPPETRLLRFLQAHGVDTSRVDRGSLQQYLGHSRPLYLRVGGKTVRVPSLGATAQDNEDDSGNTTGPDECDDNGEDDLTSPKRKKQRRIGTPRVKKKRGKLLVAVPEQKLFAALQSLRSAIVRFLEGLQTEAPPLADALLNRTAAIALDTSASWLSCDDMNSSSPTGWAKAGKGLFRSPDAEMTIDIQSSQILWRNDELKPVPDSMTSSSDYLSIFGKRQMHCGLVALQSHRHWVHVVGTDYDLMLWDEAEDEDQGLGAPKAVTSGVGVDGTGEAPLSASPSAANPPGENGTTGQPGNAEDMKSKSPSAIEFRGIKFDRILDPFDEDSLKSFTDEEEKWALDLLVSNIKSHYKDQMPFKLLFPSSHIAREDGMAFAIAGVVTQHETDEQVPNVRGATPMRGRGSGGSLVGNGQYPNRSFGGGNQNVLKTTWKEFVMYKDRDLLHVYNLISHGRRMYRSLVYSSSSPLALHGGLEPSKATFGASGDLKSVIVPEPSLVITRTGAANSVETLVPARILTGVVPSVLLESFLFWHSSADDVMRGEALDPDSTWFGMCEIELLPDGDMSRRVLPRGEVDRRRKKSAAAVAGAAVAVGADHATGRRRLRVSAAASSSSTNHPSPMESEDENPKQKYDESTLLGLTALGFSPAAAKLALNKCNGNPAFAAEWLFNPSNEGLITSADDRETVDNVRFRVVSHELVRVHSTPSGPEGGNRGGYYGRMGGDSLGYGEEVTVVERAGNWLRFLDPRNADQSDRWVCAFDAERGTLLEAIEDKGKSTDESVVMSAVKVATEVARQKAEEEMDVSHEATEETKGDDDEDLTTLKMVNLLDKPCRSDAFHVLLSLLIHIEDLSHILVWANVHDNIVTKIELPRLKLRMDPRDSKLFLSDQAGWFVCLQNCQTRKLLDCHSLLLMNGEREVQFLVPNHPTSRPQLRGQPFSTKLLCDRGSFLWLQAMDTRYYLYKLHTSGTFLLSQELGASLYLVHIKLLQRCYAETFKLVPACTADVPLARDESVMWGMLKHSLDDRHPDAHACRIRLNLAVCHANDHVRTPWEVHHEIDGYLAKLPRVSASCRLTEEEERKACRLTSSGTPLIKNRLAALSVESRLERVDFGSASVRVGGSPWDKLQSQPLSYFNNHGTSLKRIQCKPQTAEVTNFDDYASDLIFNSHIVADEESGSNRQLGFAFLYQLINSTMEVMPGGARTRPLVLGELMVRFLHLRLSRWGRESVSSGEIEVSGSRHMAQLAALLHGKHQSGRDSRQWPALPVDEQSVSLLNNGVNLYTEPGRSSAVKIWLDNVDALFQNRWPTVVDDNEPGNRSIAPQKLLGVPSRIRFDVRRATVEDTGCNERIIPLSKESLVRTVCQPLNKLCLGFLNEEKQSSLGNDAQLPDGKLPFNLYGHPAARPAVANDILQRLEEDVRGYAVAERKKVEPTLKSTETAELERLFSDLGNTMQEDAAFVSAAITDLECTANVMYVDETLMGLKKAALHLDAISFELLTQALMSTRAVEDLTGVNPTLTLDQIKGLQDGVVEVLIRVNRISHANRTAALVSRLLTHRTTIGESSKDAGPHRDLRARQMMTELAASLATRRHYMDNKNGDNMSFDPRFLLFEYVFDILLRERQVGIVRSFADDSKRGKSHVQQMIMGAGKTTVVAPILTLLLADSKSLVMQVMPASLLEQTRHVMRSCFSAVIQKSVFTLEWDRGCDNSVDVALATFKKLDEARRSRSVVCASPDSIKSLFLTFVENLHSLENVDRELLCPSSSVRQNSEIVQLRQTMQKRSDMSDCIVPIFDLWRDGVLIMDEVDQLLHPLRSELNFPIGLKDPIDLTGYRWDLPIHLFRLFFPDDAREVIKGALTVEGFSDASGQARFGDEQLFLLEQMQTAVERGYNEHALQRNPHLVLLDEEFYNKELRGMAARWAATWILEHARGDLPPLELVAKYLSLDGIEGDQGGSSHDAETRNIRSTFSKHCGMDMQLVNLGREWVRILLPHCLSKIDRVSFGILSPNDLANVDQTRMPLSRKLMAVPFVGKDVPSRSSEFAHPDVVIGLSILGYKYEGLRERDVRTMVAQLKADFARQVGPRDQRPSCVLFRGWLEHAARHLALTEETGQQLPVLPLPLFQVNDPQQLKRLHQILCKEDLVISYYLRQHVFPACMNFQSIKISACGHELGSNMLFKRRIGFSGTPSNLLPTDLGKCLYEPGSDGKVMHVLCSPDVVTMERKANWTARSLLRDVAAGSSDGTVSHFHVLIDTGALITGMDNEQVARFLLCHLPSSSFDGVVYLDRADRKMFLQRSSDKSLHLSQCGVSPSRRFTFYDQVHTTGMDIKQSPDARAVVTIGKDMTFRDYAQGSFRMRGIGRGQTIHLFLIPEVEHLIRNDLHLHDQTISFRHVPAWLLLNSMKTETVQHTMLSVQELFNCWRKQALKSLVEDVKEKSPLLVAPPASAPTSLSNRLFRFANAGPDSWITKSVGLFRENIGFVVPDTIPAPRPVFEKVQRLIKENTHFTMAADAQTVVADIEDRLRFTKSLANEALEAEIVNENEQEQQQQQEEEAEEEQEKVSRYTRDDEQAVPWAASRLNEDPTCVAGEAPFYRFKEFAVRKEQPHLTFPQNMLLSDNWFRPRWIGLGDRKIKNVMVIMEWFPRSSKDLLSKLVPALHQHFVSQGLHPTPAALRAFGVATLPVSDEDATLRTQFTEKLASQGAASALALGPDDSFFVAISLAEAESLRRLSHTKQAFASSCFSLISIEDGSCIDSTPLAYKLPEVERASARSKAVSCLRFVNGEMYYTCEQLTMLQNAFAGSLLQDRIKFFEECLRLRKRERYLWGDTPIAKLFTEENDWHLLDARAKLQQFGQSLIRRLKSPSSTVDLLSMFSRLDTDGDGKLTQSETQRLLEELRLGFSPADLSTIVKIIAGIEKHCISWEMLVKALALPSDLVSREEEDEQMQDEKTVWACSNCTFRYNDPARSECEVCGYGWDGRLHVPPDKWMCDPKFGGCTMFNSKDTFFCSVCDRSNPSMRSVRF